MLSSLTRTERTLLVLILVVAACMRLFNLGEFSMTNDELSALTRTHYSSLGELLKDGVMSEDMHPAGVQVFLYYWTKLAGVSEFAIRLPFAIAGILSIFMIFLLGRQWFSTAVGLLSSAAMSVLYFPVLYSQLSRPYSFGLLFALIAVWAWSQLLFFTSIEKSRQLWIYSIAYGISSALCLYTHYYCGFFAVIVAFVGFFYISKNKLLFYVAGGAVTGLFYLPHLFIFLHHFGRGGLGGPGGWLGAPGKSILFQHPQYILNESDTVMAIFIAIAIGSAIYFYSNYKPNRFRRITLLLFLLPFLFAYYYSIYKNPIFQHSILIFSAPFLLLYLFSWYNSGNKRWLTPVAVLVVLLSASVSTIAEKSYYKSKPFAEFKGLAEDDKAWEEKYGAKNISRIANVFFPYYIHYYFDQQERAPKFLKYRFDSIPDVVAFAKTLDTLSTEYLEVINANKFTTDELFVLIRKHYPYLRERGNYFNGGSYLFSKTNGDKGKVYGTRNFSFDEELFKSNTSAIKISDSTANKGFFLNNKVEYTPPLKLPLKDASALDTIEVIVTAKVKVPDTLNIGVIVLTLNRFESDLQWYGIDTRHFVKKVNEWTEVTAALRISRNDFRIDDQCRAYVWNARKRPLLVDDLKLELRKPD